MLTGMTRLLLCFALAMAMARHAAAQADPPLMLATLTCAGLAPESRVETRHVAAAALGAAAAKAGTARFSIAAVDAADEAIRTACGQADSGARRIAAILAALPPAPAADGDLDLAALTCLSLAPHWRGVARSLVPFMVGWRDAATDAPLTRAALDRVGEGVSRICREDANHDRRIADVIATLR